MIQAMQISQNEINRVLNHRQQLPALTNAGGADNGGSAVPGVCLFSEGLRLVEQTACTLLQEQAEAWQVSRTLSADEAADLVGEKGYFGLANVTAHVVELATAVTDHFPDQHPQVVAAVQRGMRAAQQSGLEPGQDLTVATMATVERELALWYLDFDLKSA